MALSPETISQLESYCELIPRTDLDTAERLRWAEAVAESMKYLIEQLRESDSCTDEALKLIEQYQKSLGIESPLDMVRHVAAFNLAKKQRDDYKTAILDVIATLAVLDDRATDGGKLKHEHMLKFLDSVIIPDGGAKDE